MAAAKLRARSLADEDIVAAVYEALAKRAVAADSRRTGRAGVETVFRNKISC
jgi:hypothetical protein